MASVYVTQTGAGTADGSSLANAIAIGDLTTTEWNLPAKSSDGAERIYFSGTITTIVQVLGAGGTDATDRLWVDLSDATIEVTGSTTAVNTSSKNNLFIILGVCNSTSSNTVAVIDNFRSSNVKIYNGTITNNHASQAIRAYTQADNVDNLEISNNTITQLRTISTNAINMRHSGGATDTGKYTNCSINNNVMSGGGIRNFYEGDKSTAIDTNARQDTGITIESNSITDSDAGITFQLSESTTAICRIKGNALRNIGKSTLSTNAIQTNANEGLIIENNYLDTVLCDGVGDGNAIIIDYCGSGCGFDSRYSKDCIVRGNFAINCDQSDTSACVSVFAGINTVVYGNVSDGNTLGVSCSDGVSSVNWTATSWSYGASTTVNFSAVDDTAMDTDDTITISGATINAGPDINGTHTLLSGTTTSAVIDFDSTGGNYSGGTLEINRGTGNKFYNNICMNSTDAGMKTKFGSQLVELKNNILTGGPYGYRHVDVHRSVFTTGEVNNIYWNNIEDIDNAGTPVTIDATSIAASQNPIDSNYQLINDSEFIGKGTKWWDGSPLGDSQVVPESHNGEPFSDFDTDIGANQSTFGPFHPKNL